MGSTEVIAARTMHSLHIWLDLAFLALLIVLLVRTQRYRPLTAGPDRRGHLLCRRLRHLLQAPWYSGRARCESVLVSAVAVGQLRPHQLRLDLALARSGRAAAGVVGVHHCGLAGDRPYEPDIWL